MSELSVPVFTSSGKEVAKVAVLLSFFEGKAVEFGMRFDPKLDVMILNCSDGAILLFHLTSPSSGRPYSVMVGGGNQDLPQGTDLLRDVFQTCDRGQLSMEQVKKHLRPTAKELPIKA